MPVLTRRQLASGALALIAAAQLPAPVERLASALDAGDFEAQRRAQWLRQLAELQTEFCRLERAYDSDKQARDMWFLVHDEMATNADMMRREEFGSPAVQGAVWDWLDTVYPSPALRAWRVPPPLQGLTPEFAELQAELDAATDELGEAAYRLECYRRGNRGSSPSSDGYRAFSRPKDELLRKQHAAAGAFARPDAVVAADREARRRAAAVYHGCSSVCEINARRRRWLRLQRA
jgi:hypothetical protein